MTLEGPDMTVAPPAAPTYIAGMAKPSSVNAENTKSRVVVAMSGGVDSSVTAALMQRAGHEVVGVTLQLYDHGRSTARRGSCCAGQDIYDARRVADRLGIAHYVLDFEERFRAGVIDDFAASYMRGETPIPCVRCNQRIKFKDLLETARALGADALATGHYVDKRDGPMGPELYRGADVARDQSYFLFATTRQQLAFLRFPLAPFDKQETRALARQLELPVAEKPDSQDICFVPEGRYQDVLRRLRPEAQRPGDVVDASGRILGRHEGIGGFTVGQRRGLGLSESEPMYVIRIEAALARVVVGPRAALLQREVDICDVNWLGDEELPVRQLPVDVKLRSAMAPAAGWLDVEADGSGKVRLAAPYAGVAPGQACVFYQRTRLLGGGWIAAGSS